MDFQLVAIAAAVIIIVVIMLACYILGTRERTFEDALAEQKGLGILLATGQHAGKSTDKHKDKKAHHDAGGGAKKKQNKTNETVVVASNVQKGQKKEKDEKEKVQRQRSSGSAERQQEAEVKQPAKKEKDIAASAPRATDSSRSRQSSSGEAITNNFETVEFHGKKQRQPHQQPEETRHETETKTSDQKQAAKKTGKKKRRADVDEPDADAMRQSYHEDEDRHQNYQAQIGDSERKTPEIINEASIDVGTLDSTTAENVQQQTAQGKKSQKKKQKGKQHHEEEIQQNSDSVAAGDFQEKIVNVPTTEAAPPLKQPKAPKAVPTPKFAGGDEHDLEAIIEQLKVTSLNHTQQEFVVNALLNKQEHWNQTTQKVDQLATLTKQLDEKEKALSQETQLAASLNQKLKELKQQVETEKSRVTASERTYHDQLNVKQRELQVAQQKAQELSAQCGQLSAQHRQAQEQVLSYRKLLEQAPNMTQVQQLREENQRMKDHLNRNEQESHVRTAEVQRLRQELSQRENQFHQAEQRVVHLQQNLSMQEGKQTAEHQQQLIAKDVTIAQLEQELATVKREWALLESSVRELRQQSSSAPLQEPPERNIRLQNSQLNEIDEASMEKLKAEKEQLNRDLKTSKALVTDLEKRLGELDKGLKEAQSNSKRQLDASQSELRQLKEQLENERAKGQTERAKLDSAKHTELEAAMNAKNKLEAEVGRLNAAIQADSEKIRKLEKAEAEIRNQLESEKKARTVAEADASKMKSDLDSMSKNTDQNQSNRGSSTQADEKRTSKDQMRQLEAKSKSLEDDLAKAKEDRCNLELRIQNLVQENSKLSEQVALASVNGQSEGASQDALKIQEFSLTHLNKQLIAKDGEINNLKQQLDQQRHKNAELRERNQKVVEAMNQLEKTSKDIAQKIEAKYQKQLEEQEKQAKSALAKVIPDVKIPEKETFSEWIKEVQRIVIDRTKTISMEKTVTVSNASNQSHSKELENLKKQNENLKVEIQRYQRAVHDTENVLQSIERTAESHERHWQEKVASLEADLAQAKRNPSVDLTSASSKPSKEIEEQLRSVRTSLDEVERERTTYKTELERLRSDVESERSSAKDLSSQVVKLRGMLKTGQDALKQEQDLVAQLQKQLKAFQEEKGEQQLHDELQELRSKLAQRERQLEQEMMINKQLNNKLASLGVASPPSPNVGSSNGSL